MAEQLRIEMDTYRLPSPRLGRPVLVFEVTSKVTDDLFLLVPRPRIVAILNGILGRAQQKTADFDFDLYGYYFMSNHLHLLIGVEELVDKSLVLEWVNREIARRINKYHDRTGQLLTPNHAIQITSEAHALERLRYVMGQATAQLKTRHPADDVFACANPALLRGEPLAGTFVHANGVREAVTVRLEGAGAILQGKADDALGQASCGGCAENCQLVTSGNSLECRGGSCCTLTIKTSPSAVAP